MERTLQELEILVNTVPEPIYFGDASGIYLTNNPGLELLGLDNLDQLSGPVSDLLQTLSLRDPVTQEDMPFEESPFFIALSGKKICKEVLVKNQKTERDLFLRVSAAPVLRDQKIVAVIAVGIDISEYRKAERLLKEAAELSRKRNQELVRINNELDNFFYTVSHDLKAPVNNVEGLVSVLRESDSDQKAKEGVVSMLEQSVVRLKQIISDLTDLNKIQKDLREPKYEYVSFDEITDEVESVIYEMLASECVHIFKNFDIEGIHMARKNLRSILYNLLSNAAKYRSPDRNYQIHIRSYTEGDHLILSVKDNGLGIDTSKKELFQMFKRHHNHVEGTGLGLFIVKRIVDHYGSYILVDSSEGNGTEFRLCFPLENPSSGSA